MSTTTLDTADPESLAAEYLALMEGVAALEERARLVKDNLIGMMPYVDGFKITCGPAEVLWAKGRRSEKVDPKTLRREMVLAGYPIEAIEKMFEKATTVSVGQPTMRISKKGDADGDSA
jgi:hypothetical protein